MLTKSLAAIAAALLMTTSALAAPQPVREVEVTVDLTAIQNPAAATYWTTISSDLNAAILILLGDQFGEKGARVLIDLSEVELANSYQAAVGTAESRLVGLVTIRNADNDTEMKKYELSVLFTEAAPFFPEGTDLATITSDSPEYYAAMVNAFAERVVANLE